MLSSYFMSDETYGWYLQTMLWSLLACITVIAIPVALPLALYCGFRLYQYYTTPLEQVDAVVTRLSDWVKQHARQRCMLDDIDDLAAETFVLIGVYAGPPLLGSDSKPIGLSIRKGSDGRPRFNPASVTVLMFGRDQVACFQTPVDLVSERNFNESTVEYFYKDVVGIKTESANWVRNTGMRDEQAGTQQLLSLVTSGDRVSITVGLTRPDGTSDADWRAYEKGIEPQVNMVRQLIRERKRALNV